MPSTTCAASSTASAFNEPVQLVGNSFGGTIALSAALWVPERVASLVLIEANPAFAGWGDTMVADLEDLVEGFDGPGMRAYIAADAPRKLRKMVDRCEELVTKTSLPDDLRSSRPTTPEDLVADVGVRASCCTATPPTSSITASRWRSTCPRRRCTSSKVAPMHC